MVIINYEIIDIVCSNNYFGLFFKTVKSPVRPLLVTIVCIVITLWNFAKGERKLMKLPYVVSGLEEFELE